MASPKSPKLTCPDPASGAYTLHMSKPFDPNVLCLMAAIIGAGILTRSPRRPEQLSKEVWAYINHLLLDGNA